MICMKLTTTQMDELKNLVDEKMQDLFDSMTYLLEDFVGGEQYDSDENVCRNFLDLRQMAIAMVLKKLSEW